jgi:hypothetical protein
MGDWSKGGKSEVGIVEIRQGVDSRTGGLGMNRGMRKGNPVVIILTRSFRYNMIAL